ncbi:MAG: hypothetical protein PWR01_2240 [Clostridiales bacterium]|nr:hypothetical protein [Clostridiales bacterium]MDN5281167.1 hypothetical protein [Candidatus Ozemobacter sp.]
MALNNDSICPYCLNSINRGAQKCHHCREWLTQIKVEAAFVFEEEKKENPGESKNVFYSFQGRLASKFSSINYWFFYLAVSIVLFAAIATYWTYSEEDRVYLISFFLYAIQMFCSSAGVVWFEKLLERFKTELPGITGWTRERCESYYNEARAFIFADRHSFITAAIVCIAAVLGDKYLIGSPFRQELSANVFLVYEVMYLFWTACLCAVFFKFALFVRQLGDLELHILLIQEENAGIRLLGKLLLRTALFVVIPYFLGIFARQIGGWNFNLALIGWFACFGVAILFYMFYPIYNIHRAMIREKDRKLSLVAVELNHFLSGNSIARENIHNIKNLIEIRDHLHDINTWPFDMNNLVGLLSALVIPMASILIDRFMKGG